jgi:hypothetical protein
VVIACKPCQARSRRPMSCSACRIRARSFLGRSSISPIRPHSTNDQRLRLKSAPCHPRSQSSLRYLSTSSHPHCLRSKLECPPQYTHPKLLSFTRPDFIVLCAACRVCLLLFVSSRLLPKACESKGSVRNCETPRLHIIDFGKKKAAESRDLSALFAELSLSPL